MDHLSETVGVVSLANDCLVVSESGVIMFHEQTLLNVYLLRGILPLHAILIVFALAWNVYSNSKSPN